MITASALDLLARCPGQAILEHWPSTSAAADDGTRQHAELVPSMAGGPWMDSPRAKALRESDVRIPAESRLEVAYAVDVERRTARTLEPRWPRDYDDVRANEIPGTADWDALPAEVGDFKTGAVWVADPASNRQLHHAVLTRWYAHGMRPRARLVQAMPPDGSGHCRVRDLSYQSTAADLEAWREDLLAIGERVERAREVVAAGERAPLVLGDHCAFCSVKLQCPALADAVTIDRPGERALAARAALSRARAAAELADALLVTEPEHALEDGRALRPVTKYRRAIDVDVAVDTLPGLAGFTTRMLTMGAFEAYARTRADWGDTIGERIRHGRDRLEEAGALTITTSTRYEIDE